MTNHQDHTPNHLANDVLIRAMDDELAELESAQVESHLSQCVDCKQRYLDLRLISDRVDAFAASLVPQPSDQSRAALPARAALSDMLDRRQAKASAPASSTLLRRFGWGMALAATLALGILFAPHKVPIAADLTPLSSARGSVDTFEVNGETFVALPYSNPDLPVSTSHVVQMQVPVSSLTEAGVAFEPVSTQQMPLDHSVLADVLVGLDGQPLGLHVLSEE